MRRELRASLSVPRPRSEVFAFFSDAANLEAITPPELSFEMLTPAPVKMESGARIEYRLTLWRIAFRWRTLIRLWRPPCEFVDDQLSGPYAEWSHHHAFEDAPGGGTVIHDRVRYRLPLAPLGDLAHPLVRRQLEGIFAFRQRAVAERFGAAREPVGG